MSLKRVIGLLLVIPVLLFSAGCGAGLATADPTLPWEGTQDPAVYPPPDATQTIQPTSPQEEPGETATSPPEEPLTDSPTATLPAVDSPTTTITPTETSPADELIPSPTHTQPLPAPTAPPDANFNTPLTIPLDSTASVTDFVSYPNGDTIDRVRFDVSGMNPNAALSGGRARLILAVSCFGTGTQNITFFTGGQTYSCGQTIFDQEITYDSRTGTVTIEAVAGENTYVQWVLTGTATRVN